MSRPLFWTLPLLSMVLGCGARVAYSPPVTAPADETITVAAPFDQTWQAVIQTFFQRNIPIRTLEKASGIVESDELHGEVGRDCDCGSYLGIPIGGYGGAYGGDAYYRFRVLVERRGEESTAIVLRSSCRARVESVEGDLACRLTGSKEQDLRQEISGRAARPNAAP